MLTSLTLPSGTQAKRMEDYVVLIEFGIECYPLLPSGIAVVLILEDNAATMTHCSTNTCRFIPTTRPSVVLIEKRKACCRNALRHALE